MDEMLERQARLERKLNVALVLLPLVLVLELLIVGPLFLSHVR